MYIYGHVIYKAVRRLAMFLLFLSFQMTSHFASVRCTGPNERVDHGVCYLIGILNHLQWSRWGGGVPSNQPAAFVKVVPSHHIYSS